MRYQLKSAVVKADGTVEIPKTARIISMVVSNWPAPTEKFPTRMRKAVTIYYLMEVIG